jgi:pimeloyl-ACP methyl ester carboxylesterase
MSEEEQVSEASGRVIDREGVRTHIRSLGDGGVPLVLLHGVLSEGASWWDVAVPLSRTRTVVMPDQPLHGRTEVPRDFMPDPEGMVSWLEALLDDMGYAQVDLCGLSMGGAVAFHFARLHPDRVRRLVLVDAANIVPLGDSYMAFIREMRGKLEAAIGVDVVTSTQCWTEELGFEGAKTAAVDLCTDPIVMSVLTYLEDQGIPFKQAAAGMDLLEPLGADGLRGIRSPTMAIWGADDPFFSADEAARAVSEGIPGSRIEVFDGTGHNPITERPERFVALMEDFLGN